jgi:hypothetical protein
VARKPRHAGRRFARLERFQRVDRGSAVNHRNHREIPSLPAGFAARDLRVRQIRPQNAKAMGFDGPQSNLRIGPMYRMRGLQLCALSLALPLLPGAAGAQTSIGAAPAEVSSDAPLDSSLPELDLSTPELDAGKLAPIHPSSDKTSEPSWFGKVGVDYTKPAIPATTFQPEQLTAGAVPDQSTGVAWATVTAPGMEAPLGWDKTSIDTRIDPAQEQSKLGTTLSRSVPLGDDVALTWQNGISMTHSLPNASGQIHGWASSQALRFNFLPTDTSVAVGADISSSDDKWLRTLSAEQKLFGGPFNVTGSVSETPGGELSKSLRAGFKRSW